MEKIGDDKPPHEAKRTFETAAPDYRTFKWRLFSTLKDLINQTDQGDNERTTQEKILISLIEIISELSYFVNIVNFYAKPVTN